jgi:hypothetical protein
MHTEHHRAECIGPLLKEEYIQLMNKRYHTVLKLKVKCIKNKSLKTQNPCTKWFRGNVQDVCGSFEKSFQI